MTEDGMLLFINTTSIDRAEVALVGKKNVTKKNFKINRDLSEKLLPAIQALLGKSRMIFSDLLKIAVVSGSGSFTSIRIGVATANALAYSLKIPIFQVDSRAVEATNISNLISKMPKMSQISPIYGGLPNITKPKRRKI